jgi:hypothetical protein
MCPRRPGHYRFEPGFSGQLDDPPAWLDDWEEFVRELEVNFGPYDETGEAEHELVTLKMLTGQHISKYIIRFNSLATCCNWGNSAL